MMVSFLLQLESHTLSHIEQRDSLKHNLAASTLDKCKDRENERLSGREKEREGTDSLFWYVIPDSVSTIREFPTSRFLLL